LPFARGTAPAGSRVREKSRFRLYSVSAGARAADRAADRAAVLFVAAPFCTAVFFAAVRCPARLVVLRVAGRFTARLDGFVVAMGAPVCEERARDQQTAGPAGDQ
jgi:hypothetical protein